MRTQRLAVGLGAVVAAFSAASLVGWAHAESERDARASAVVELGRRLFFDPAIGRQGRIGCADCHDPEHGFSDARTASVDESQTLARHSQSLVGITGTGFHWDGEFATVREVIDARIVDGAGPAKTASASALRRLQTLGKEAADAGAVRSFVAKFREGGPYGEPVVACDNGEEMLQVQGVSAAPAGTVAGRLARLGHYESGFRAAFGDAGVTSTRVGDALEAYVASLKPTTSPFDRFVAGDRAALGVSAQRGLELFRGKAGCVQCHTGDRERAVFTDGKFHNTGVAAARSGPERAPDIGRLGVSFADADRGAFKTPSLRDVAKRAPYFHDGSETSLAGVVRYYDKGGTANDHLDSRLRPLGLTDGDVADIVAFLESLTGEVRPGLGARTALRAARVTVRVADVNGKPAAGIAVTLRPFGDRLAGTTAMPEAVTATTGADGTASFDAPESTHFVAEAEGLGATTPLPDWTATATFVVPSKDRAAVRVRFPDDASTPPEEFRAFAGGMFAPGGKLLFTKVRDLGPREVLYVTAPRARATTSECTVCMPQAASEATFTLDLSAGAVNSIGLAAAGRDANSAANLADVRKDVAKIRAFAPKTQSGK